ncbi:MAG: LacI family DNA-binding transcriptional regulator [Lachnospiraceae bacterium]|nr:LacI family DNA-binding transcriptional regulator [Lachnospiraceae bacterium]
MKKLTIKEIADQAKVSIATVSRVMNHKGGYSQETGQRVNNVIQKNEFGAQKTIKNRMQRESVIGILVPDITNDYFSRFVQELQKAFTPAGYLTVVCNSNGEEEVEQNYISLMKKHRASGIILFSGTNLDLQMSGMPTVYVGREPRKNAKPNKNIVFIESDNRTGGYLITKELIEKGCKNIAFISDVLRGSSKMERYQGYCNALMEAGMELSQELILKIDEFDLKTIGERLQNSLNKGVKIDGIMCVTDGVAMETILALEKKGIRVPEDIKVTGFDDSYYAKNFKISVTTIRQQTEKMASLAAEKLLQLIKGEDTGIRRIVLPVEVITRKSTEEIVDYNPREIIKRRKGDRK